MAENGIKADTNRIKLEEQIPLSTPMRVVLEASSVCNFHCSFCVHGNRKTKNLIPQGIMSLELARKCIKDLASFPEKIKMLAFESLGEPLVNKNLPEIISTAVSYDIAEKYEITTNASLLTRELSRKIVDAGVNLINISVYGLSDEAYREFSGAKVSFEDIVNNVTYIHSISGSASVVVKISDANLSTDEDRAFFLQVFSPICDKITIEHAVPIWYDFDASWQDTMDIYNRPIIKKEVCPLPFYILTVNANGIVSPCCIDWKIKLNMGDASSQSLQSIWHGMKYRAFQKQMLTEGAAAISPCSSCGMHIYVAYDNIDKWRGDILERIGF